MKETPMQGFVRRNAESEFDNLVADTERDAALAGDIERSAAVEITGNPSFMEYFARKLVAEGDLPQDYFTKDK